uniref:Histone H2A n=1 Tax=Oryza nivara TaxID=4536 RepID=A0A0E0HNI3_ORYNI
MDAVGSGKVKKAAGGRKAGGPRKKAVTRSVKAGLQFPVGRIGRYLKNRRPVDLISAAPSPLAAPTLFPTASVTPSTLIPIASVTPPPPPHRPSSLRQ